MSKWVEEKRQGVIVGSTLKAGNFKISVHRHIHYPPNVWLVDCRPFYDNKELASKNLEEAKCQATALVLAEIENALKVLISA